MAKEIKQVVKIQLPAGSSNPGMVGTSLGPTGVNMVEFTQRFNEQTKNRMGETVPATITIYDDRSYEFTLSQSPASELIMKAAGIKKGSATSHTEKVGHLNLAQLEEIAEKKMPDLNANDITAAMKIIAGSARSMGVTTDEIKDGE